ncbi:zinc finger protein 511 [Anabrus simplex]|uniref:zinc finger protein 511 n=1 Tax=Anabrus simplex TaxID=316456 RepID=UPI0034DD2965
MASIMEQLLTFGTGHRRPDDPFFAEGDSVCKALTRLGVYDIDDEELCHEVVARFPCHAPGCRAEFNSLLDFETHYNGRHRFPCVECKKQLPSAHLLDLHLSETHDSFFLAQAERKPMYQCYVEECGERFSNSEERRSHCISGHQFPHDFRFDEIPRKQKKKGSKEAESLTMETDAPPVRNPVVKARGGRMWHSRKPNTRTSTMDVDTMVKDLQSSLPQ